MEPPRPYRLSSLAPLGKTLWNLLSFATFVSKYKLAVGKVNEFWRDLRLAIPYTSASPKIRFTSPPHGPWKRASQCSA
jgi:hypothetical protein